jgi:hypothetical protein
MSVRDLEPIGPATPEIFVRSNENRSAGSVMGAQLRRYCNEQRFTIERWRNR